jgi:hypothetical protein
MEQEDAPTIFELTPEIKLFIKHSQKLVCGNAQTDKTLSQKRPFSRQ